MSLSDDLKSAVSTADVQQNLINTVPELREFIHFDTLWQMASLIVLEHGHLEWTDTAEHDPGTTLLQAATYAIADLSYRHTHPLVDLLTPGQGQPVFDPAFGPEKVLTVSPVTEDDYRRGILDLCDDDGFFMFRNAQLVRESGTDSYQYLYNSVDGTFSFPNTSEALADSTLQVLLGGYTLYVEPYSWFYRGRIRKILDDYLMQQRNLGEQIRSIFYLSGYSDDELLEPYIDVDLDDDCQNPAQIIGEIWRVVTTLFAPWPQRELEASHLGSVAPVDKLYEGPSLEGGWITQLPPDLDYTEPETLDLRNLSLELLKIDGIKNIRRLSWSKNSLDWTKTKRSLHYVVFWNANSSVHMTKADSSVRLFKRGQRQMSTSEQVQPYIRWPKKTSRSLVAGPTGQFLESLGDSLNISGLLPDCYGLNDDINELEEATVLQRQRLRDYLALFQQWVANGCTELAGLPQLLAFNQPDAAIGSGYFQDYEKGLATINYLLGYFGSQRAPRVFNKTGADSDEDAEFFESQRAALAQWAELGYGRANVPVNTVTAFNKRLAFRLGIGSELFSEKPDLEKLPVYVIDYRTLLPEMPNVNFLDRTVKLATLFTTDDGVEQLNLEFENGAVPVAGQLISLLSEDPKITILWALVVRVVINTVEGEEGAEDIITYLVYLDLNNNPVLREKAGDLDGLEELIVCNNSDVWLRRISYPLDYEEEVPTRSMPRADFVYLLRIPYSVHLFKVGDTVAIDSSVIKAMKNFEGVTATVTEVNIPDGTLLVTATSVWPAPNNQVFWYRVEDAITDRFSLKVGVVLDRERWLNEDRPEEVMAWVAQIVREEMPAHIQADVHWLSSAEFIYFSSNYKKWQEAAAESRLGDTSYALLKQLSLGQLPAPGIGIGVYHIISSSDESATWYDSLENEWREGTQELVESDQVMFIPRSDA